jgi:hypothetical protein
MVILVLLLVAAAAFAAEPLVIEDWSALTVGAKGIPARWQRANWSGPASDFVIEEDGGRKVLRLRSADDSHNINLDVKGRVNLRETPILEWSWKVTSLPQGADSRRKETDDQAAQLYVVWPRFPEAVRSRIIGYVWDSTAPAGLTVKSQKTGTVTYVILRSGAADLGKWVTERRNVREDFKRIYGDEPDSPSVISIGIDSDDVKGSAESFLGAILFRPL